MGYENALCNECTENFGKVDSNTCVNCEGANYIL